MSPPDPLAPEELRRRILEAVEATPSPTRRRVLARTAILLLIGAATGVGLFVAAGSVRAAPRPTWLIIGTTAGWAVIALTAVWFAFGRGRSAVGRSRAALVAVLLLTPALLLAWKVYWSARYPAMTVAWPERIGLRCFALTFVFSLALFVAMIVARTRADPVHPALTGAALGMAAGACAGILVDLWCPVAFLPHLLLGHILPLLLLAVAGAWLGRRFLALRKG